jgi:ketosteroid isomerase-like protein
MACTRTPAPGATGQDTPNAQIVRKWYAAWLTTEWAPLEALMADDFNFTSPAGDDHIDKATYKAQCWATQHGLIERFDLEQVADNGTAVFVRGTCHTKAGKSFRNVEYFTFKDQKISSYECYFGDSAGYPSAANKKT